MDHEEKIFNKLESIDLRLGDLTTVSRVQAEQLKEHIRRTNLLEAKIQPVERHVFIVNTLFKTILTIASLLGALAGIYKAFLK